MFYIFFQTWMRRLLRQNKDLKSREGGCDEDAVKDFLAKVAVITGERGSANANNKQRNRIDRVCSLVEELQDHRTVTLQCIFIGSPCLIVVVVMSFIYMYVSRTYM